MCPKSNSQKVNEPGFELRQFPLCCTIEISPKFQVIVILSSGLQIYICVLWQKGDTTNSSKALGNSFPDSQLRRTLFPKNRLPRASLPLRLVPFCNSPFLFLQKRGSCTESYYLQAHCPGVQHTPECQPKGNLKYW